MKVTVSYEFDTSQEAANFIERHSLPVDPRTTAAPVYHQPAADTYAPPQQPYQPPAPVQTYAPAPDQGFTPPMPQNYAPPQAPTPPAPPQAPPQQPAGGPSSADVVKAAQAYAKKFGPAGTKAVLQQFGADAVKDVKPEHYVNVIAALAV